MLLLSTILVVFVATFLLASIAVVVAWFALQRKSDEEADIGPDASTPVLLKSDHLSTVSLWGALLAHFDFVEGMKARLAEAGLNWTVGRLTAMMLLCGALPAAILWNVSWFPLWAAPVAGVVAGLLPYFYVLRTRTKRLNCFEEQLPDALDFLARALRAGHPFAVSLELLVQESIPPLSLEMRKTFDERQLGLAWDQALQNLARRVPLMDVSFFAAAVQLQSRTGGKLGEVLARLSETMRERFALRGEIRAIATHGRLSGTVLTLIPIVVVSVMALVNPDYVSILFNNPLGRNLVLAALGCLVLAHFVIRRIVNVKL